MAIWNKTCNEFKEIRDMIDREDSYGIMNGLLVICKKYAKQKWLFSEDFDDLGLEIDCAIKDGEIEDDDDCVNYYLEEFYDLCDTARVWLPL